MSLEVGLLRTRVARRILLLFILSALLPAAALSVVSYRQVRSQLIDQSKQRLTRISKSAGMAVYERLLYLQSQLELLRTERVPAAGADSLPGIEAVAISGPGGEYRQVVGQLEPVAPLTQADRIHMSDGMGLIRVRHVAGTTTPQILIGVPATEGTPVERVIWGRVDPVFLWSSAQGYAGLSTTAWFCVFDAELTPLLCDVDNPTAVISQLSEAHENQRGSITMEWTDNVGRGYLAGAWQIFLDAAFHAPSWDVVVAEDRAAFLAPLVSFRMPFLAAVVFALAVVALLSNIQIRRSLEPLVELSDATRRIASKDFDARVNVSSGDEFEELGASFNTMAQSLNAQFSALEAIAEIDRAILSELDRERIATTVLERLGEMFPADRVSVILRDPDDPPRGRLYASSGDGGGPEWAADVDMTPLAPVMDEGATPLVRLDGEGEGMRRALRADPDIVTALIIPLWLRGEPAGYIALGHNEPPLYSEDDLSRLRQIADQVAVALSNADLLDELEHLTWGALTALARAIDAKSPWTAGHSERVTAFAVQIGEALDLDDATMETLRRGGLLHDIGKIGIPGKILDKAGPLTDEEMQVMGSHTRLGARILEPIPALENAIPIVLSHHERFDGKGYPDGLAGESIPFLARVLAVADVYDALTSDRPYRAGLDPADAMGRIVEGSGTHFDPLIVDVFQKAVHIETGAGT